MVLKVTSIEDRLVVDASTYDKIIVMLAWPHTLYGPFLDTAAARAWATHNLTEAKDHYIVQPLRSPHDP